MVSKIALEWYTRAFKKDCEHKFGYHRKKFVYSAVSLFFVTQIRSVFVILQKQNYQATFYQITFSGAPLIIVLQMEVRRPFTLIKT